MPVREALLAGAAPRPARAPGPVAWPAVARLAWMTMRLTVIGCAGSFPGPDSPASCYLVEADGFRLLLDLGNGALGGLQRHAGLFDIDAICLSHLHGDHCLDMAAYWVARTYAPDGPGPGSRSTARPARLTGWPARRAPAWRGLCRQPSISRCWCRAPAGSARSRS